METHGWKNRETRLIHIWISNDESLYLGVRELVSRYTNQVRPQVTPFGQLALCLAVRLREEAEAEYNNPQG